MSAAPRLLRYLPEIDHLRRGLVYAASFLALAGTGWLTGETGYYWSATASLWTCLADRTGSAAQRLSTLGAVGLGGALAGALGAAVALTPWAALAIVLAAGLAAGLAETRSPAGALCAKLLYVVLIAACLQPAPEPALAARVLTTSLDYLRGGVFACLVCLTLIPSRRDTRPRTETAAVYDALLRFAQGLADPASPGDTVADKRDIRNRIEAARAAISARRNLHDPDGLLRYTYIVSVADALFALLIVAAELRDRSGNADGLPLRHAARCVSDARDQVTQALSRHAPDLPALCAALAHEVRRLAAPVANAGAPPPYQSALATLARYPTFDSWRKTFAWPRRGLRHVVNRWRSALGDHATRDGLAARHAMRLALAGGLSLLPAQWWHLEHGYWVAVTVIMVLSPQLQTTRQISLKRFAGSLAGALLACAIGLAHPGPVLALAISASFLAVAYANRLASQPGGFAFCLTPAVILFSWVSMPATDSSHFAALRGVDTAVGCLIALASYFVLAPRAEMSRVFRHGIDALAVNAVYLRAALATSRTLAPVPARLEALRVAAGRASTRAEHTLAQAASGLSPELASSYTRLHGTVRRMAALAGVVRAAAEAGQAQAPASLPVRAMLEALEARLAELAIRPGLVQDLIPAPHPAGPAADLSLDAFLAEQAAFAEAHIRAAHAAVAESRELGKPAMRTRARRQAHPG